MVKGDYISVTQLAEILGISRSAVHKKIKAGQIEAVRIGRSFAIPRKYFTEIMGRTLSGKNKKIIDQAVKKTFAEYGEVLRLLGKE